MSTQENQIQKQPTPLVQIKSRRVQQAETDERIDRYHKLRDSVAAKRGREYWRSLDELSDTPEFREYLQNEFPEQASEWNDPKGRRQFIKLMGASLALAGFGTACAYQPRETIIPYVEQPEEIIPNKPLFFATAMPMSGIGLLARSNEGRPTKIEGNPDHPGSLGSTDVFAQAAILQLYDPDRSQTVLERGEATTWQKFIGATRAIITEARERDGGAGIRILTETVTSPTLGRQMQALLRELPQARWIQYEPCGRGNAALGAFQALGAPLNTVYRFAQAVRVLSIDSDFLSAIGSANLRYSRDYMERRQEENIKNNPAEMNRLYAVEVTPKQTGAKADHRLPIRPSEVEAFTRTVAAKLGVSGAQGGTQYTGNAAWVDSLVRDLQAHQGRSIVIVGDEMPASVHALAHAMNAALGNVGTTLYYTDPIETRASDQMADLRQLVGEMNAGTIRGIIIVSGNPVYTAPADLNFGEALKRVNFRAHLSMYNDETSQLCNWHVPESHFLEAWSDTRSFDGTISIVQPLIEPLYDSHSAHEVIGVLSEQPDLKGYNIVRETYSGDPAQGSRAQVGGVGREGARGGQDFADTQQMQGAPNSQSSQDSRGMQNSTGAQGASTTGGAGTTGGGASASRNETPEKAWRRILHEGIVPNTAFPQRNAAPAANFAVAQEQAISAGGNGYEVVFRPDPCVWDGRFANNGWLQELPKPLTKLTWDNAAMMSLRTARKLGVDTSTGYKGGEENADIVRLSYAGKQVEAPVWILPGQPDDVITLHLGYGRMLSTLRVANGAGFNANALRTSAAPYHATGVQVERTGSRMTLATTQSHYLTEDREPVRVATIEKYVKDPKHAFASHHPEVPNDMSLYPPFEYDYHAWGMTIDTNSCVGCNSCVIACQAENNIPVIGKEQVGRSREMHWLRIDAYYRGSESDHNADEQSVNPNGPYFQPLMCVHCELAPCEPVCPVHATVHDAEGLNVQIYNRCVGTRYCSNNCPYKVRRFNFLLYQDWETPQYELMRNPEVSVRSRGVMEKCTYCTQRIQWAKIEASKEGRRVRDGEIVTACQAACPTQAIVFGDLSDPESTVRKMKASTRDFSLLGELNTRPRTTYLGALRNPNLEIEKPGEGDGHGSESEGSPNTTGQEMNQGAEGAQH